MQSDKEEQAEKELNQIMRTILVAYWKIAHINEINIKHEIYLDEYFEAASER